MVTKLQLETENAMLKTENLRLKSENVFLLDKIKEDGKKSLLTRLKLKLGL